MVSAVGTGSVLFTPRVAATYGYQLVWVLLSVCGLMWVMIREAARYSVATGGSLLDGVARLPGPRSWGVWATILPQLVAAVVGIAGLAAVVGSALAAAVGGTHTTWAVAVICVSTVLVTTGGYRGVERAARVLAGALLAIAVVAAVQVAPGVTPLAGGVVPTVPSDIDPYVVVPWIGTILAGSMGIVWFSYWTRARGYGVTSSPEGIEEDRAGRGDHRRAEDHRRTGDGDEPPPAAGPDDGSAVAERLRGWFRTVSLTAAVGVVGGATVLTAFLVLGAELLAPQGIVPQGTDVAEDLARLLEGVWGEVGYWLMILAVVVAIGGSVLANQDGWGRSFADMSLILADRDAATDSDLRRRLRMAYVVVVTALLPVVVVLVVSDPVAIMSASGLVAALHTPVIVVLVAWTNRRELPPGLRPGPWTTALMALAALTYAVVGVLQVAS